MGLERLVGIQSVINDMPDMAEAILLPHFQQAVSFISSAVGSNGKVLVHCQAGVSRSASVSLDGLQCHFRP